MTKRIRKTFTEEERHRCWQLWQQGLCYNEIAREIASKPGSVFGLIRLNGYESEGEHRKHQLWLQLSTNF